MSQPTNNTIFPSLCHPSVRLSNMPPAMEPHQTLPYLPSQMEPHITLVGPCNSIPKPWSPGHAIKGSTESDTPEPWGLFFQDNATPQMEGLEELHNNIMFYLADNTIRGKLNDDINNNKLIEKTKPESLINTYKSWKLLVELNLNN